MTLILREAFKKLYEAALCPGDPTEVQSYISAVWIKYQIAHYLQPSSIVELGVRAGYSSWAMRIGCPTAKITGIDSFVSGNQGSYGHEEQLKANAERLFKQIDATLVCADTQTLEAFPKAELYHVDADHNVKSAYNDITFCLRANPGAVVIVHDANHRDVIGAALQALQHFDFRMSIQRIDSHWGDAVIAKSPQKWVGSVIPF